MKSVYLKNFFATALVVLLCFLMVGAMFVGVGRRFVTDEYRAGMQNSADEVARTASAMGEIDSLSSWALSRNLTSISRVTGNHIFLTDENGVIVSCSDETPVCRHMGMTIPESILKQLRENGRINEICMIEGVYEEDRYVVASTIERPGGKGFVMGYVFVTNGIGNMLKAWSAFQSFGMMAAVFVLILALIISLVFSKKMARPLDEMAAASAKFARGDFSVRVRQTEDPSNEMGALIESFNKMADSLENAEARRSEFIANISHELRTPMTTIAGFADGILDGTIPKTDEEKYLRTIRDETRRLSRLVRDMLDVSQMRAKGSDPAKRTVFDLTELVLQVLLSFETSATKKELDVDPQLPDNPLMVRADKDGITQVIYNLIDNAVKFAKDGSCIVIRLYKDSGKAYISVKDEGETIPADDLPFIFDRFHKSDRSRSLDKNGVGLGLYLVKAIINAHDEDIAVKSEDGVTEFVFTLPLAE